MGPARGCHRPTDPGHRCRLAPPSPSLNASFDGVSLSLRPNTQIDLGLAIDSPDGLFVPVLRDVGRTTAQQWRSQIDAAKRGVSERSLAPGELRGATITLSNFGTIAGQHATLIIVPPQVAILGAGRITSQPMRSGDGLSRAPDAAPFPHLRSPRNHWRRGRALPAHRDLRS